jgi:hypothetical protein
MLLSQLPDRLKLVDDYKCIPRRWHRVHRYSVQTRTHGIGMTYQSYDVDFVTRFGNYLPLHHLKGPLQQAGARESRRAPRQFTNVHCFRFSISPCLVERLLPLHSTMT